MLTNLGLLIDSQADEFSPLFGLELIKKKVDKLEIIAGCFSPVPLRYQGQGETVRFLEIEYNILGNVPLAQKVIMNWPDTININDDGRTSITHDSKGNAHVISFNHKTARDMWTTIDILSTFHP